MCETGTVDADQRDLQVGRLVNDYLDRKERGEAESLEDFLAKHTGLADQLSVCLRVAGNLRASVITIGSLIERAVLVPNDDPDYPGRLRDYKVAAVVGEGATGIVLKAYQPRLDRLVALKVLRPEFATQTSALTRFQREARAAAALRHPNIVTVHDLNQERGVHYVAMEYIPTTLSTLIHERGPLPPAAIRHMMRQLLSGLAAAHEAKLIHRDIKPSNILIDCGSEIDPPAADRLKARDSKGAPSFAKPRVGDGPTRDPQSPIPNLQSSIVKVADFGLARTIGAQTRISVPGRALGTPAYMSPEQANAQKLDHRTDLYSAGVVLYEMLTGRCPFVADSFTVLKDCILREEPPHPRKLNKNADAYLSSLAQRLMAKKPEDRLQSAKEAIGDLDAGRPVASPERQRHQRKRVAIAVVAIALLSGGGWLLNQLEVQSQITEVKVVMDDGTPTTKIAATYGDSLDWKIFHDFGTEAGAATDVVIVDLDGNGNILIVAGTGKPVDGGCLFAFDPERNVLRDGFWPVDLFSDQTWPDCAPPTAFGCASLACGDLDGQRGDEIVVAACNVDEYATRLSIIDPREGQVRSTFWHMGRITQILVAKDFLGPGRPAIIAMGPNNKLDGFREWKDGDASAFTCWDQVQVVMVIDPSNMTGERLLNIPPSTHRVDIPPVLPLAYAFFDGPCSRTVSDTRGGRASPRVPQETELVGIPSMFIEQCPPEERDKRCIRLAFKKLADQGTSGAIVTVNHDLDICPGRVIPTPIDRTGRPDTDEAYWHQRWRVIVRNGEYVDGQPAQAPSSSAKPQDDQGP